MIVERLPVGVYAANCYIVYCKDTKEAIVVDPGGEGQEILKRINDLNIDVKYIILTHGHGDHIGGVLEVKNGTNAPVLIHSADEDYLKDSVKNLSSMMSMNKVEISPDILLKDGDKFKLGEYDIEVIHTPGHTPGGISLKIGNNLFTGDTLFAGSIGRTDFEGGSYEAIISSIKDKLVKYPDETEVFPGHGPSSTIGREKKYNPFIIN